MDLNSYTKLIYKELKGEITAEELHTLRTWEADSEANQQEAESIRNAWEASAAYDLPFELDLEKDFAKIKPRLVQSNSTNGKVRSMNPRRNWMSIAAGVAVVFVAGFLLFSYFGKSSKVAWIEVAANNSIKKLTLPDGSKVTMNKGAVISYPTVFANNSRPVKLKGEAFFEVTKDPKKPFNVSGDDLKVTVLGTAFGVNDAEGNGEARVNIEEGKVRVKSFVKPDELILVANETANLKDKSLTKVTDKNLNDLAWKRKSLKFSKNEMIDVIDLIAEQYKVEIILDNPFVETCSVSGRFSTDSNVEKLLKTITSLYKIEVQKTGNKSYLLIGGNCK